MRSSAHAGPCGGKGSGEQPAARELYPLLDREMLLLADRNFYSFTDWCQASQTGAELLWRLGDTIALPLVAKLGDGSYTSLVFASRTPARVREQVLAAAAPGRTCSRGPVAPGWSGWSSTTCRTGAPTGSASCSAC